MCLSSSISQYARHLVAGSIVGTSPAHALHQIHFMGEERGVKLLLQTMQQTCAYRSCENIISGQCS